MTVVRKLMAGLIDYAGLFPPAALPMKAAVESYAEYLEGPDSWALGRFVVPAARLEEFSQAFNNVCCGERERAWSLSVLLSSDRQTGPQADTQADFRTGLPSGLQAEIAQLENFARGAAFVDALEVKADSANNAASLLAGLPEGATMYVEFPPALAPAMLPTLSRFSARAKLRTGGVTANAFPSTDAVAAFLVACAAAKVGFKATAGLHHALRGEHRITYEPGSRRAVMHGFVNVLLAASLAWSAPNALMQNEPTATLQEESPSAFTFEEDAVRWHGHRLSGDEIEAARSEFAIGYGSCSFLEPLEEVRALGWL
jgi:hypothetical protein